MIEPWNIRLGEIIRKERKQQKLTQEELGNLAGTGLNFVSQVENGKSSVRFDKLMALLHVLGIELHVRYGKDLISTSFEYSS